MTRYGVHEARGELVAMWEVGQGAVASTVAVLPATLPTPQCRSLAAAMSYLSMWLWRRYTHPEGANGFGMVLQHVRRPNLRGEDGGMLVAFDPVAESAHEVGQVLHDAADPTLTETVLAEVEAEISAVERAELGDLTGRSVQAVELSRHDVSPVQVAAADRILADDPLGGDGLFLQLDPASACVAAVHWLKAAADVAARASGIPATHVVAAADSIEAVAVQTPSIVLGLVEAGMSPTAIVTTMVGDAMAVADGELPTIETLRRRIELAEELAEHGGFQLTPLDPGRPARDMLEVLLDGIRGCWLLYRAEARRLDLEVIDAEFRDNVRSEALAQRHRLAFAG
jgi:hypothetical protein